MNRRIFALALAATAVACKEQPRQNADGTPALSYAGQDSLLKQKDSVIAEKTRQLSEQSAIIGDAATSARLISDIDKDLAAVRGLKSKKSTVSNVAETEANASSKLENIQGKVRALIDGLDRLARSTGLQLRLRDHGIPADDVGRLARESMKQERLLVNNPCEINEADARRLYEAAW